MADPSRTHPGALVRQIQARKFQDTLEAWEIRSSMRRKSDCWDNAHAESLWGHLKTACVHGQRFATREQPRQAIMNLIGFYNHAQLHSKPGYMRPMQYEQRWLAALQRTAA